MENTPDPTQLTALRDKLLAYLQQFPEKKWSPYDTKAEAVIIVGNVLCVKLKPISEGLQPMEVPYIEFMAANNLREEDLVA